MFISNTGDKYWKVPLLESRDVVYYQSKATVVAMRTLTLVVSDSRPQ